MPKQLEMDFTVRSARPGDSLLWYDDTKGRSTAEKVAAAARRFRDSRGYSANVVLCNAGDCGSLVETCVDGAVIVVRAASYVRPFNFLVGRE